MLQKVNTGCFAIGEVVKRRYIKTAKTGTCDFDGTISMGDCRNRMHMTNRWTIITLQKKWIDNINRKGGVAFVVHNGNEALALLQANNCI